MAEPRGGQRSQPSELGQSWTMLPIKDWHLYQSFGQLQSDIVEGASTAGRLDRRRPVARRLRFEELFRRRAWASMEKRKRWWHRHMRNVLGPAPGARRVQAIVDAMAAVVLERAACCELAWSFAERLEAWHRGHACM